MLLMKLSRFVLNPSESLGIHELIEQSVLIELAVELELDVASRPPAVLDPEDLLTTLQWNWLRDRSHFGHGRMRVQQPTFQNIETSTGCRPGELVERWISPEEARDRARKKQKGPKALCYKDIQLMLLRYPDDPSRCVPVMEVTLWHTKNGTGYRRP